MKAEAIDPQVFKKILKRNVSVPLVITVVLCATFIGLVVNLLNANRWVDHTDRVIAIGSHSLKLIVDSETALRGYLISGNKDFLGPHENAEKILESRLKELKSLVADNPAQAAIIENLDRKYQDWLMYVNYAVDHRANILIDIRDGGNLKKDLMDSIRDDFQRFTDTERLLRAKRTEATESQTILLLVTTIILSLGAGVALVYTGRRQLMNLSDSYNNSLQKQYEQNNELANQSWIRNGQAQLSNTITGEKPVRDIGKDALEFILSYVDATLGTLFVVEDSKLKRVAGKFYTPDHNEKEVYHLGEGLVGEVAQTRKIMNLTNLPAGYLKIASSLGETTPHSAMLIPIISEGTLQGVMELGFLEEVTPVKYRFLESIAEILGTGIKSALYRSRLQQLLEETQAQSEELQSQQEELRVSNEELIQRSEALLKTQTRLENQHSELEQATSELEKQRQALDTQNKSLLETQVTLDRKNAELEQSSRYKSEFLANMSHELRTPLNSTLILSKLLKDNKQGNLSKEQVEFAETIYSSGNDLLTLINDILDLSKVEAGKLDIIYESLSLESFAQTMKGVFGAIAREKNLDFEVVISPETPKMIETDKQRVEQILKNLLSNAMKFTEKGFVKLLISPESNQNISFNVIDTGIGISAHNLESIFEAFRQADGTTNRKFGGTGLGLTISRNLAELLGGDISVTSEEGKGSTFKLILPLNREAKAKEKAVRLPIVQESVVSKDVVKEEVIYPHVEDDTEKLPNPGRKLLLVVEDDIPFAQILRNIAHENDFLCLIAVSGDRGYELAVKHRPDAIILDIKLPDALGLQILDRLKENPKTRHIPVHAISGMDYSKEALRLGAIGYLHKPAQLEAVNEVLQKLKTRIDQKTKQILIVEDDNAQREAVSKMIQDTGVNIVATAFGNEALSLISERDFDCVIMDLSLPDMSGLDVLRQLAANRDIAYPPIIIYTGRSLSLAEEDMLRQYSETIIIKGARSPERLLSEVTLFLHQVESQMSEEKQSMMKEIRSRDNGFEGKTILVADDDARNIFALLSLLESKGAKAIVARNGKEALTEIDSHPEIDLVLMDIMMPEMDGYTAIRKIRERSELKRLPIIAVTAKAMRDDYERCIEAGANDYLAKPVDVEKLVSLMRVWIPTT